MPIVRNDAGEVTEIRPREALLQLTEIEGDVATCLNHLHGQLAVATELSEKLGDSGRSGIFRAMNAIIDFCASQGIPRATLYPVFLVAQALVDADNGISTAAFEPDKSGPGRPPVSISETAYRAHSAVVAECCIRQKKLDGAKAFKADGLDDAARILRSAGWGERSASELGRLREDVTSRAKDDLIRSEFERMMDSAVVEFAPREYAKLLATHGFVNLPPVSNYSENPDI